MNRRYKKWTKEEIEILKAYYGLYPAKIIAKILGRSAIAIYVKAHKLKLKSDYPKGKIPKLLKELIEKYYENNIKL